MRLTTLILAATGALASASDYSALNDERALHVLGDVGFAEYQAHIAAPEGVQAREETKGGGGGGGKGGGKGAKGKGGKKDPPESPGCQRCHGCTDGCYNLEGPLGPTGCLVYCSIYDCKGTGC